MGYFSPGKDSKIGPTLLKPSAELEIGVSYCKNSMKPANSDYKYDPNFFIGWNWILNFVFFYNNTAQWFRENYPKFIIII